MTKLAIVEEREEDRYAHRTALRCWKCDPVDGRVIVADDDTVRWSSFAPTLSLLTRPFYWQTKRLTDGIMQSLSSARQSEVKAWEEEIITCEHALLLEQHASGAIAAQGT